MLNNIRLHLGCGQVILPNFVNIDVRYLPGVDRVQNIRFLRSYKQNSVDLIYCACVLQHFSRWDYMSVLQRWYSLLKPNGIIRISVPDFQAACKYYMRTGKLRDVSGMLFGGQDYPQNQHHWTWDFNQLKKDLQKVGFKEVKKYNWRDLQHCHIDDGSQAYLPHMDKQNGQPMSLNVQAIK